MKIYIASGVGTGPTALSAFDSALNEAGIANYNIIRLSSVIPPNSIIINQNSSVQSNLISGSWGDRLCVVMAEQRVDTPNAEAWAGIGWVQDQESGKGLFVEHEGNSEATVRKNITQSLEALMTTRQVNFGQIHMKVAGETCTQHPVCVLVVAVFQTNIWEDNSHLDN